MLLRLVLLVLALGAAAWCWRAFGPRVRALLASSRARALDEGELTSLSALAQRDAFVAEALALREGLASLIAGADAAELRAAVDDAVRQVGREAELLAAIGKALAEHDEGRLGAVELRARERLAGADEPARSEAEATLAAVARQREARARLDARRDALTASLERAVLELREARLAVLDAAASPHGVSGSASVVRDRLRAAREGVQEVASAHDELSTFLAGEEVVVEETARG